MTVQILKKKEYLYQFSQNKVELFLTFISNRDECNICGRKKNINDLYILLLHKRIDFINIEICKNCKEKIKEINLYQYIHFLNFYSKCPICGRSNHKNTLKKIFLKNTKEISRIREYLIKMMEEGILCSTMNNNFISTKILCCKCYKKILGNKFLNKL